MISPNAKPFRPRFPNARHRNFGYDATEKSGRRRMAAPILRSEDYELLPAPRKQLVASQRDLMRNFAVARWIFERHLDYVATFKFKFRSKNRALNQLVEQRMKRWFRRQESDIARRHGFDTAIRLAECTALTANDCLAIKLGSKQVQWIEGDRLANPGVGLPPGIDPLQLVHGVQIDDYSAAQAYIVCRRGPKGSAWQAPTTLQFEQVVQADDAILHGFFDRFDQVRGVSPVSSALNSLQDVYEAKTYALGRMKIDQLFAIAVFRGATETITERSEDGQDYTKLPVGNGPIISDMDVGDRMEAIQSSQPSNQFQDFMVKALSFCMKALAIPYSFFDEAYTNYSGARQALLQYESAAEKRRNKIREMLDEITDWILQLFMFDGELPVISPADYQWEWVSQSLPWIDPLKEAQANIMLIGANLESEINVLKQQGREASDVIAERVQFQELLKEEGLQQAMAQPATDPIQDPEDDPQHDDPADQEGDE